MNKVLITAATFKPLEIDQIKDRPELHIDGSDHDVALADFLESAIEAYEEYTGNILCLSTWDLFMDSIPEEIETPGPLSSITSIKYLDTSGTEQTLAATVYKVTTSHNPLYGLITLKYGQSWPSTYAEKDAVYIRFVAGFADPGSIPRRIKDGLLLKIQELYDGLDRRDAYESCWADFRRWPI